MADPNNEPAGAKVKEAMEPTMSKEATGEGDKINLLPPKRNSKSSKQSQQSEGQVKYAHVLEEALRLRKFYVRVLGVTFGGLLLIVELILSLTLDACDQPLREWLRADSILWIIAIGFLMVTSVILKPVMVRQLEALDPKAAMAVAAQEATENDDDAPVTEKDEENRVHLGVACGFLGLVFLTFGTVAAGGASVEILLSFTGCNFATIYTCLCFLSLRVIALFATGHVVIRVVIPYLMSEGYVHHEDSFGSFASRMVQGGKAPGCEKTVLAGTEVLVFATLYADMGDAEKVEKNWSGKVSKIHEDGDAQVVFDEPVEVERRVHKADFGKLYVAKGKPPPAVITKSVQAAKNVKEAAAKKTAKIKKKMSVRSPQQTAGGDDTGTPAGATLSQQSTVVGAQSSITSSSSTTAADKATEKPTDAGDDTEPPVQTNEVKLDE